MKVFFLSDQHLHNINEEKCQALLRFFSSIRSIEDASQIFLVGDIFDLWVGSHEYFVRRWQPFNAELMRLVNLGIQVHYFEGNHDLYLSSYFGQQLGLKIHGGPTYFRLDGKVVRVEHGDQMDPEDKGYLFLRKFLRTPLVGFLNRKAPGRLIAGIGEWASQHSRKFNAAEPNSAGAERVRRVTDEHIRKVYAEKPFDIFIAGHFHLKDDRLVEMSDGRTVRAINLGYREQPISL